MVLDEVIERLRGMDAEEREKWGQPLQVVVLVSSACGICALEVDGTDAAAMVKTHHSALHPTGLEFRGG
jgi:hypothetical protein